MVKESDNFVYKGIILQIRNYQLLLTAASSLSFSLP